MSLHYLDDLTTIHHGGALDVLRAMPDESVHSIVTDPPYGLSNTDPRHVAETITRWVSGDREYVPSGRGFMGKEWDAFVPPVAVWDECLRVLKPGGHLLAFAGSRTADLMGLAIRLAGFDMRDTIMWLYGSGFPKSHDVSKGIDKARTEDLEPAAEVARFLVQHMETRGVTRSDVNVHFGHSTAGSGAAQQWTTTRTDRAIKPRVPKWEQWQNLREWLDMPADMDDTVWRLNGNKGNPGENYENREVLSTREVQDIRNGHGRAYGGAMYAGEVTGKIEHKTTAPATEAAKRWQGWGTALKPAHEPIIMARKPFKGTVASNTLEHGTGAINVDGCRIAGESTRRTNTAEMGYHGGNLASTYQTGSDAGRWPANVALDEDAAEVLDQQSGIRSAGDRPAYRSGGQDRTVYGEFGGQDGLETRKTEEGGASRFFYVAKAPKRERPVVDGIAHPTVKPLTLMRWLVRMVTPPDGVVLDPFVGSGTTVEAAILEEIRSVGIELSAEYLPLIEARIERSTPTYTLEDLL